MTPSICAPNLLLVRIGSAKRLTQACGCGEVREALTSQLYYA